MFHASALPDGSLGEWSEAMQSPMMQKQHVAYVVGHFLYMVGGTDFGATQGYYAALP